MKHPLYNAAAATLYIVGGVWLAEHISARITLPPSPLYAPMIMLSLLVLSVAVMGFLFVYQPLLLLLEQKRAEAVRLFLSTVGIFAVFTACLIAVALWAH